MFLETEKLIIRSIQPEDEAAFIEMASDGSLMEIFGDCILHNAGKGRI